MQNFKGHKTLNVFFQGTRTTTSELFYNSCSINHCFASETDFTQPFKNKWVQLWIRGTEEPNIKYNQRQKQNQWERMHVNWWAYKLHMKDQSYILCISHSLGREQISEKSFVEATRLALSMCSPCQLTAGHMTAAGVIDGGSKFLSLSLQSHSGFHKLMKIAQHSCQLPCRIYFATKAAMLHQ